LDLRLARSAQWQLIQKERRCASSVHRQPAPDYWYAKNPTIKTLKDTNGYAIAYSSNGSLTHSIVRAFIDEHKLTGQRPNPPGSPSATLTAVMTNRVDVG
jgi:hypothetical protein